MKDHNDELSNIAITKLDTGGFCDTGLGSVDNRTKGKLWERIAREYLQRHGLAILEYNFFAV